MTKTVSFNKDVIGQYNMDPDIKDEWLAALRSGEYQQGKSYLKTGENEYCCLGVLCVIFGRHQDQIIDFTKNVDGQWTFVLPEAKSPIKARVTLPHPEVYKWAGLNEDGGQTFVATIEDNGLGTEAPVVSPVGLLPGLNDTHGYSFSEIADYIERYL
jgi:hypothetical protein